MVSENLFIHVAPINNINNDSDRGHTEALNVVFTKARSSTGSFAVRRLASSSGGKMLGGPVGRVFKMSSSTTSAEAHSANVQLNNVSVLPHHTNKSVSKRVNWGPVQVNTVKPQHSSIKANQRQNSVTADKTTTFLMKKPSTNVTPVKVPVVAQRKPNTTNSELSNYEERQTSTEQTSVPHKEQTLISERKKKRKGGSNHSPNIHLATDHGPDNSRAGPVDSGHVTSIFTGNPAIPSLTVADVTPVTEAVFSEEGFASLNISPVLITQAAKLGYESMTAVQARAVPAILRGSDVLVKSQTGSGKTLTYALPLVNTLMTMSPPVDRTGGVRALVVVPTRELALQTYSCIQTLCRACVAIVPGYLIGGEKKKSEKNRLRRGVNILVATPGRLMDHIRSTECLALQHVRVVVLDEADRMLEMGYEKSVSSIMEAVREARSYGDGRRFSGKRARLEREDGAGTPPAKRHKSDSGEAVATSDDGDSDGEERPNPDIDCDVADCGENNSCSSSVGNSGRVIMLPAVRVCAAAASTITPDHHQTVMLSATLTAEVQRLAGLNLHDPETITVSSDSALSDAVAVTPSQLEHHYCVVPAKQRLVTLAAFILSKCLYGSQRKMIVFMATQDMVDYHTALLQLLLGRYGSMEREEESKGEQSSFEIEAQQMLEQVSVHSKKRPKETQPHRTVKQEEHQEAEPLISFLQLRGNMQQADRTRVFNTFCGSASGVLLCTDVAARGLDVADVAWIVQYCPAATVTDYVHRVGRTARTTARGQALTLLAPHEAEGYVADLQAHRISIKEIEVRNILAAFTLRPPRMEPQFQLPRSLEEGANRLQTRCERLLLSCPALHDLARKAYISFVRAYASYPTAVRDVFCFKSLHLGHYAKSFGLREAPTVLGAGAAYRSQTIHSNRKMIKERTEKHKLRGVLAQKAGAVPFMATVSEFDSGLDGLTAMLAKHRVASKAGGFTHETTKRNNRKLSMTAGNRSKLDSSKRAGADENKCNITNKDKSNNSNKEKTKIVDHKNKNLLKRKKVVSTKVKKGQF